MIPDMNALQVQAQQESSMAVNVAHAAETTQLQNDQECQDAAAILVQVQSRIKYIEDTRKGFVKPLNDHVKNINAFFKGPRAHYERAKQALTAQINNYNARKEAERQQAMAVAQQMNDAGDVDGFYMQTQIAHDAAAPILPQVHNRTTWVFEVEDISKVPLQFLQVNEKAVRAYVQQFKEEAKIPGIKVFQKTTVVPRS